MSRHHQESWLQTPLGGYLQQQEQALFDAAVGDIFGFNAVQFGLPQLDLLRCSRMPFALRCGARSGALHCLSTHLPLQTNSIDLLLLPHVLEFSDDPHQTLREAGRVLVPEGHLLLSGFNPMSAWGIKRMLARAKGYPWHGSFFTLIRIRDWLALLDFEIVQVQTACRALPVSGWLRRSPPAGGRGRTWWPATGGVYFIVARKRVLGMRVIRPDWKKIRLEKLVTVPTQRRPLQQQDANERK